VIFTQAEEIFSRQARAIAEHASLARNAPALAALLFARALEGHPFWGIGWKSRRWGSPLSGHFRPGRLIVRAWAIRSSRLDVPESRQ